MTRVDDLDGDDLGRVVWPIAARIGRHACDLLHQIEVLALSEDGVFAVEVGCWNFGDEELRAVGVGPAIGHRQPPGLVEGEGGTELIFEAVSRITRSIAYRIDALNHEIWDDPVKDGAVVERHTLHHLAGLRVLPGFCSSRQPDNCLLYTSDAADEEDSVDLG